ncbi:hypothetical protein EDD15DRAFT_2368719 [Pisolithus albus]|nr:hypothetical protein EDD15DRAFT_2368719 [Pisolithus albus]
MYNVDGSNHPDCSPYDIRDPDSSEYFRNLLRLTAAPIPTQYKRLRMETGVTKPSILLGLDRSRTLGIPDCLTPDIMHLAGLLSDLHLSLWRGTIECTPPDHISQWPWAIFKTSDAWETHGALVSAAAQHLPGSFDRKPRNPAEKISSGYKTWEFQVYIFYIAPALLYGILGEPYWRNFCKLISQSDLRQSHVLLTEWPLDYEALYCQRSPFRLHFVRPCVHQVAHLTQQTVRKGPPICYSQWTMERTIGNLGQEIRQPANPYANLSREGVRRCQVNALKAMVPSLCPEKAPFPSTAVDLGNGYVLLRKRDARPILPRGPAALAISHYLGRMDSIKICRWARLRLPNGQIARTAWRELLRPPEQIRPARFVKFVLGSTTRMGEVEYFTRLATQDAQADLPSPPTWLWKDVAVVTMFSPPDANLLKLSYHTVHACQRQGEDAEGVESRGHGVIAHHPSFPSPISPIDTPLVAAMDLSLSGSQTNIRGISSIYDTPQSPTPTETSQHLTMLNESSSFSQDGLFSRGSHPQPYPSLSHQYMFRDRAIAVYEGEIEELKRKLLTTTTERDTIRAAFQSLISVLKLPEETDPLSFSLTDINVGLRASESERVRLSKKEYPGLRFRVRSDYDSFAILPEAQSMDRGKAPWLEQENGNPVTPDQLKAIRASLRRAWAELVERKLAPPTWTKISASGKALVYKIMTKEYPLLGLDEDGFKLEMLCVNDYSGWRKNHLTPSGQWKESSHKTEPKEEPKQENTGIISPLAMKGKKRESNPKLTQERTKRHKECGREDGGNSQHMDPSVEIETLPRVATNTDYEDCPVFDVALPPTPHESAENVPFGVFLPMPASRSRSGSLTEAESAALVGLSSLSRRDSNKENMMPLSVLGTEAVTKASQLPTLSRHNSNKENEFSLQDPLANVFGMNGIAKKPPPAPTYPSMPPINQERPEPSISKIKKIKMRPGAAKNARNLCAHRWLKQVNTNGTTEDFRTYWDSLTPRQREDYRVEAERLEGEGKWTKPSDAVVCNGTMH